MANQIIVTQNGNVQVSIEPTPNVQVQISRAAIGTISNVPTANFANYAANVTASNQPNITSLGTLTSLTSGGNITAPFFIGNVIGNISGNLTVPGTNTAVLFNQLGNAGASDALKFNYSSNVLTANGNIVANYYIGNGSQLTGITATTANFANFAGNAFSIAGANVSGAVANATFAVSSNTANSATVAASANSVAVANVSGIGNIATVNLDGNLSNILYGNGIFAAVPNVSNVANANFANFAGTAFNVSGSNVTGAVANATYANTSGSANTAGTVTTNAQPNITSVGTLTGLVVSGNITPNANITYDLGNNTNRFKDLYLAGNSIILGAQTISANATNISFSGNLSGDASGLSNIVGANVTGQVGNALVASTVYTNAQPNITSLGNLTSLTVSGDAGIAGNLTVGGNISYVNVTNLVVQDPVIELGGGPNGAPLTTNDGKDRGTLLHYYTTQPIDAFMGWDNGNGEFAFGSNVTNNLDVMTFNTLGNVRAQTFIGNLTGIASSATVANSANAVAGANVSGAVAFAATANSVAVSNVSGLGNIATTNFDGNASNVLYGNGNFYALPTVSNVANANYANFAGTAFSVSGSNVSGAVANAIFADNAGNATIANSANSVAGANVSGTVANATYAANAGNATIANSANSVAVANVSGIGNIATINLDGNVSNLLTGNGTFVAIPTVSANANYANFAGTVITNAQPNITSVGTLTSLNITGNVSANAYQLTTSPGTLTAATGQMVWSATEQTMNLGMNYGVTQQVGLETYILIKASATISDGQVIMFTGANGDNVTGAPANTASAGFRPEYIIGVATQNIANNGFGYVTVFGSVHGLNTNAYNVGDILWVDNATPGALTATRPSDPNYQIEVAAVTKKSGGDGHIQVRVTTFNDINSLTDVTITTPANGQALVYSGNVWVNGVPAYANIANSVAGANVTGAVAFATTANAVAGGNVSGAVGLATFATTANAVAGANVSGAVAFATTANSVAVANVSGIGNIATVNLTGSSSNVLYGNGVFAAVGGGNTANANYANFAGNVVNASQSNITSLGTLISLDVNGSANVNRIRANGGGTLTTALAPMVVSTAWNNASANMRALQIEINDNGSLPTSYLIEADVNSTSRFSVTKAGNIDFAGVISGNGSGLTNLTGANITGTVSTANTANTANTVINPAQSNITSLGTLTSLSVTGTTSGDRLIAGGAPITTALAPLVVSKTWNNASANMRALQIEIQDTASLSTSYLIEGNVSSARKFSVTKAGNIDFAGVISGNGSGLSNLAVANITGIGNIATLNLNGNSSQVLYGNGIFAAVSGGGTPGGANTQLQFNANGVFGGISTVTWNGSNLSLGAVGNVKVTGGVNNEVIRTDGTGNLSFSSIAQTLLVGTRAGPYTVPITNYTFQVTTRSSGNVTVYVN